MTGAQPVLDCRDRGEPAKATCDHAPVRVAHLVFVLWVAGLVASALYAAEFADRHGWWVVRPLSAAILVLALPVLVEVLAQILIRATGNRRLR